ncbi:MAG: hypothetical protein FWF33_04780 [Clostridiales bacterium]|nr:hypothetical protein [Clostridiales bacterium]
MSETLTAQQAEYRMDRDRWARLSFDEQMGNIGSEVGRAIAARRTGKLLREERAIARAIDLFSAMADVLIGTPYAYRLKEVLRARDEFLRLFYDGTFEGDADNIERYFMWFAWRARLASAQSYMYSEDTV